MKKIVTIGGAVGKEKEIRLRATFAQNRMEFRRLSGYFPNTSTLQWEAGWLP